METSKTGAINRLVILLILMLAATVRLPYVIFWDIFYNSDTAILGLMAKNFLNGKFSLYYWGGRYYGSLDPVLLMPLFKIFGSAAAISQLIPFTITVIFLYCYHYYIRLTCNQWIANIATLILAVASPFFMKVTFNTYNYIITLTSGLLHFILIFHILYRVKKNYIFFLLGFVVGFSYFYFRLIVLFWLAIGLHLLVLRLDLNHLLLLVKNIKKLDLAFLWNKMILL
ncbi:MAG: hypothetical protein AB1349_08670, partial [Elusimicrobiota bacterium]